MRRRSATLRDLVRTGERLSNDNETKAFDLLEERFRATGAEVKRETVPLFVSTVPHAHLEVNGETLRAQGNAMTAPVTTGAGGSRRFRVTGKPVPWTDDIKAPEEPAVAVVTGLANLGILRRAERLGFAGVLFVTGERIHRMIVSDVWGSPVPGVEDRYVSIPNASIDNATAERLGNGPVTLEIETESRWIASPVLTATLPGTESDRYALLTGHIDSWGAGAIDNASGLAASTAILDTLAETPHPYGLKVVVWSGHSHGRYAGSTAWCDRHASELARSAFLHVNLDCLGMAGSTLYGFIVIVVFMAVYYQVFGIVSGISLMCNVMMLVAILSLLQATLTLPGIAAIALTLGMAVDSNVLINERVREELRIGRLPQMAISEGYERAFATILDSNVTSLIAGLALLIFGSGPVRGFAVVHCLGIGTSIFTSVVVSRALVNLIYGRQKKLQHVHIGEVWRPEENAASGK